MIILVSSYFKKSLKIFLKNFSNGNVIDSWLIAASRRVSETNDEQLLLNTLSRIESMNRTLGTTTRDQINANIKINKDWINSEKYSQSLLFINNFLNEIDIEESRLRLPKTSVPTMYKIRLDCRYVHNGSLPYTGEVSIDISITKTTDRIMFHSKRQTINELKVFDRIGNEIKILDFTLQTSADSLTIYFMQPLMAGSQINVNIKYSTSLLTSSTGFYRTSYVEDGVTKYLAATQFQPSSARYAFPHYDGKF